MTANIPFNGDWFFAKFPISSTYDSIIKENITWTPVTLPHDWLIYDTMNLYQSAEGWYHKTFELNDLTTYRRYCLRFEGVYMNSYYYINGRAAGTWKYGYTTFELDITDFIQPGKNELYVQVIFETPNSRWYSGAGIYRKVWLKAYPDIHLVPDGIYIHSEPMEHNWLTDVTTEISLKNTEFTKNTLYLQHSIIDKDNNLVAAAKTPIDTTNTVTSCYDKEPLLLLSNKVSLTVQNPALWDIDKPSLYRLETLLLSGDDILDQYVQTFGYRTLEFDSLKGFFLNGRNIKLHGACEHHDFGCLGAAVHKDAIRRKFVLLKEMGVNAIRSSHNMPAVEFMELADEMGLLIVSEAFDMWERSKTSYDYARFFTDWWKRDVACWVRRDRNHPSILMWSIGNEIYDTHAGEQGLLLTKKLQEAVLVHDPKQNARVTIGSNYMPWENARKCADVIKLAGYNYGEKYYELHHTEYPDWIIYGSETSSTVQSRGIYHFPFHQPLLADDDEQCSSLGNSSTSWGAKSTEACIIADRDADYSPGQFIWTGFDYLGEPTPYHTKNSYFGQLDTAGFPKDSFYIYQAEWTDYKTKPMIHVFPYWDFSNGQLIDIRICSNAPKIELFFNGTSQGTFDIDHKKGKKLIGHWQLPYKKGVLKAVAYDETNTPIAWEEKSSFGDAYSLAASTDKQTLQSNGVELAFIEINAVDINGIPVENANNRILLEIEGPGLLMGLDNGDSTDYDQYKGNSRRLFSGKLLAVITSTATLGKITVKASSKGLKPVEIVLDIIPASDGLLEVDYQYGYYPTTTQANSKITAFKEEIPIRKLELICPQGNLLTKATPTLPIIVKIHPTETTYSEVCWRVTNAAGIDSNLAVLSGSGTEVQLQAIGDGIVYVRCSAKNGTDNIQLFSQMEFFINDFGKAFTNPYELVSAGNYTFGTDNLTNGNERGIATARDGKSIIGFTGIDFGDYGSDQITLPVFSLDGEEFSIEIWEGDAEATDGILLTTVTYQKPSIWNVYQEEIYQLPKRLRGITSISFVLYRKIHLKGFFFTKYNKALEPLSILNYNQIYGDTYTLTDTAITNIGNNVTIVFKDLDFEDNIITKVLLCGHSPLDNNTMHLIFSDEEGENRQIVEFSYSEDYVVREFNIEPISGKQNLSFVFLPGCLFDFKWFQFQ
jgi:beta-galactosidase